MPLGEKREDFPLASCRFFKKGDAAGVVGHRKI